MSVVTNLIISTAIGTDDGKKIATHLAEVYGGDIMPDLFESGHYGGTKALEADLRIGAYNYLDMPALLAALAAMDFEEPENVQVFAQEQEEDRFTLRFGRQ